MILGLTDEVREELQDLWKRIAVKFDLHYEQEVVASILIEPGELYPYDDADTDYESLVEKTDDLRLIRYAKSSGGMDVLITASRVTGQWVVDVFGAPIVNASKLEDFK